MNASASNPLENVSYPRREFLPSIRITSESKNVKSGEEPQKKSHKPLFSPRQGRMFKKIWESTSDAIGIIDSEGILIYANDQYFDLYKFSSEDMLGRNFSIIFSPEYR